MNKNVDQYIEKIGSWKAEMIALRKILHSTKMTEEWKWKQPCYTFQNKNVVIIGVLKDSVVLSFFKGALLKDKSNLLIQPGKNTQSARYLRFGSVKEISKLEEKIKSYLKEAIKIEEDGVKLEVEDKKSLELVEELVAKLKDDPKLKVAFESLSPGRQRGYNLYFAGAKQVKTRIARIDKHQDRILQGYGIHDCICGLSKRLPNCDGSHKQLE